MKNSLDDINGKGRQKRVHINEEKESRARIGSETRLKNRISGKASPLSACSKIDDHVPV